VAERIVLYFGNLGEISPYFLYMGEKNEAWLILDEKKSKALKQVLLYLLGQFV